ncbi:hypothetical protein GCM10020000_63870 [Streptomyces olivoverticillatus]
MPENASQALVIVDAERNYYVLPREAVATAKAAPEARALIEAHLGERADVPLCEGYSFAGVLNLLSRGGHGPLHLRSLLAGRLRLLTGAADVSTQADAAPNGRPVTPRRTAGLHRRRLRPPPRTVGRLGCPTPSPRRGASATPTPRSP